MAKGLVLDVIETPQELAGNIPDKPRRKRAYVPVGYDDEQEFIAEARELYNQDRQADKENLDAALDDLKFAAGDQWDKIVLANRQSLGQPCLTINTLPQFIGQVVGDRRVNQTAIKVLAREDADVDIADIRSDLIRNIENQSRAQRVYNQAFEQEVICGIGNFRVDLDYADDDVFDRDIFIRPIPNALAVTWDYMSVDPTGRDAYHCFVDDMLPKKAYEKRWPGKPPSNLGTQVQTDCSIDGWITAGTVRVTEYWRMIEKTRVIALMADGKVIDITDKEPEEYEAQLYRDPLTGQARTRKVQRKYAQMHLITGFCILEGPYEIPLNRLPIIRCNGREVAVGDARVRFGLVRFAKDPQRLKNFWRSVAAEMLSKAPRNQWLASSDAVEGRESDFRSAHLTGDPLLIYNKNASAPPELQPGPQVPAAVLNEAQINAQDMKDVTGIHDASLGIQSNETSGIAIQRRQQEGDVATIVYHDNMNAAVQEAGDIVNQLIPLVYDTARTIRVIGPDEEHRLVRINDPNDPDSIDLAKGKYDVTIATGPAYMTRRLEAANSMLEAVRVDPQLMQVAGDLIAKAQDWPDADQIAERIKRTIPPQILGDEEQDGQPAQPNPEQQAAAQQQAMQMQAQQQQMQMELQKQQAELEKAQADAVKAQAQAREAFSNALKAEAEAAQAGVKAQHEEIGMHASIARHLDEFSGAGQPSPAMNPQPGL